MKECIRIGLDSIKANALPMAVLWFLAVGSVACYYMAPGADRLFDPLFRWQVESGWLAAFLNRVAFCGLLPGVFLLTVKSIRPPKVGWVILAYSLWAGMWGVLCDWFFTLQAHVFGNGHDWLTLLKKTLVDQLVWNVVFCTPANAVFFPWVASGFTRPGSVRKGFWPMLVTNWMVWMPVVAAVYAFPLPLQIQLVGLAGAYWMLVALRSGR